MLTTEKERCKQEFLDNIGEAERRINLLRVSFEALDFQKSHVRLQQALNYMNLCLKPIEKLAQPEDPLSNNIP